MLLEKFLRTYFGIYRNVRFFFLALCLTIHTATAVAEETKGKHSLAEQLAFLDPDAGLILSLKVQQLHSAYTLASDMLPKERKALNLAGLGTSAILGFYPFSTKAWSSSGFDTNAPILVQLAATKAGHAFTKTRIVLKARNADRAQASVRRMRFREKESLEGQTGDLRPLLAQISKRPTEAGMKEAFRKTGVFLIARPAPLQGLLFAQVQDSYLILDLFEPTDLTFAQLVRILQRKPGALNLSMPGAWALQKGPIGLWLRSSQLGKSLRYLSTGCSDIAKLGRTNSIQSVGLAASVVRGRLSLDIAWHLRKGDTLLQSLIPEDHALLGSSGLLSAHIYMASWGKLRDRSRPSQAQSWDRLWANTKNCGRISEAYILSVAWPEILGLFLSELSSLAPSAATVIESAGGMSAHITAKRSANATIVTEAWVRGAGARIAKGWLATLFGSEQKDGSSVQWGRASIQPYAVDMPGGSVVGAGYRPGSRDRALASTRKTGAAGNVLVRLWANPSKLVRHVDDLAHSQLWKRWRSLTGRLSSEGGEIRLSVELRR